MKTTYAEIKTTLRTALAVCDRPCERAATCARAIAFEAPDKLSRHPVLSCAGTDPYRFHIPWPPEGEDGP